MGHRLPTILGKAVDDVIRTLNEQASEEEVIDLVQCIERMEGLMTDLSGNAPLRYIVDGQSLPSHRHHLVPTLLSRCRWRSRRCFVEQGDRQVLPRYGCIETTLWLDLNMRQINRKDIHERPLGRCRSIQIPSSPRMFRGQQILEGI